MIVLYRGQHPRWRPVSDSVAHDGLLLGQGARQMLERSVIVRVLILAAIFLGGYLEDKVLKRKDFACATWFLGLGGLTAWIAYPLTMGRMALSASTFIVIMALMIGYYRR